MENEPHSPADGAAGQPRVSVVMCTYNGAKYLREQMDSILAQDYPLHEIIVQDDGSTDATPDLLEAYRRERPELFRLFRNEENLGFNRNFHTAMLRATGDLIAIADQDDIWFTQKIRRQVETIGEADLCFSDNYVDPAYRLPLHKRTSPRTDFELLIFHSAPGHSMLLRRDFLHSVREWNYAIYYDWWLVLHAAMRRGVTKVNEPLCWHRRHAASVTTRPDRRGRWEAVKHPTWQPYLYGYFHFLHLQRNPNYRAFYTYLRDHIDPVRFPLPAKLARLMLRRCPFALLRLCWLCGRNYKKVYPGRPHGLSGRIHGFFMPLIWAYGNDSFRFGTPQPHKTITK